MFNDAFKYDYYRHTGHHAIQIKELLRNHALRYLLCLRGGSALRPLRKHLSVKYGLELGDGSNIAPGLYLGHAYGITVNPQAVIGKNCSLHKGCTIGQENRGARKGAPTLGERVWVGSCASIVGKVTIGNDVLVAPNAYVNHDVPDHSIVIGNPCKIIPRHNATEGYVTKCI